ncbi:MAG: DNA polymerase ligase N-terminal domain-containing protein [Planctomycetota bacterium]|jgi:hypothetical protein
MMPRFVIQHHVGAPDGDHYDLMLEEGDSLMTWKIGAPAFTRLQSSNRIEDHRKKYLDYEGEVSGDRGKVAIWDRGEYTLDARSPIHLRVALRGEKIRTRLCFDLRGEGDSERSEWLIYDGAERLRRLVSQHLRRPPVVEPEDEDLLSVREDLSQWERRLAALADRFTRGQEIDWSQVNADRHLPTRIRDLSARWRHPWLVRAYRSAMRLDRWIRHMLAYQSLGDIRPS